MMPLLGEDPKDVEPGAHGTCLHPVVTATSLSVKTWNQPVSTVAEWLRAASGTCPVAMVGGKPATCANTAGLEVIVVAGQTARNLKCPLHTVGQRWEPGWEVGDGERLVRGADVHPGVI